MKLKQTMNKINQKHIILSGGVLVLLWLMPQNVFAALTVGATSITTDSTLSLQGGNVGVGELTPGAALTIGDDTTRTIANGVGDLYVQNDIEVDARLVLPMTTSDLIGVIYKGTDRFIHNYAASGTVGHNTFAGLNSGNFTMSGTTFQASHNVGFGYYSLFTNTSGSYNTAVGSVASYKNTTGLNNASLGYGALYFSTTGSYNTALGTNAISFNGSSSYNTAVGESALYDLLSGAGANTVIGYNTGRGIETGVNNTIIGANVTGLSSSLSNNIIIADGAGNQRINVDSAGDVGIATNDPTEKLDINSNNIRIRTAKTPASAADTCDQGEIAWDTDYIYICTATNTWKRSAITTW